MTVTYRYRPEKRKAHAVIVRKNGRERWVSFATEAEARRMMDVLRSEREMNTGWLDGVSLTVEDTLRAWLSTYRATMASSTVETNEGLIENHLVPFFGKRDLRMLKSTDMIAFADHVLSRGKSAALAHNALSLLRRVCSLHVEAGLLTLNPAKGVKATVSRVASSYATEVARADAWSLDEINLLLALAEEREPRIFAPLLCLLHTGMRRGEMLGLRWSEVDFTRGRISIVRALVRGRDVVPKSKRARDVEMTPRLRDALERLAGSRAGREGIGSTPGRVFTAPGGGDWDAHNFGRVWRRLRTVAARHGVRPLRLHDCRHTFATLALEGGKSVTWVSRVLGHSDPSMTLRVYAHVLPEESGGLDFLGGGPKVGQRWAEIAPPKNPLTQPFDYVEEYGDPGAIRTRDPQLRRLVLYPAELPGHSSRPLIRGILKHENPVAIDRGGEFCGGA